MTGGAHRVCRSFNVSATPEVKASLTVDIPRKSGRPKKGRNPEQSPRQKRRVKLQLRYCPVSILPPTSGLNRAKRPIDAYLVHGKEAEPPADGSKAVEWFLLTTHVVDSPAVAEKVFRCYVRRWRIEEWHRALKTCCGAEEPAHRDAARQKRLLAINLVIAWRLLLLLLLGREVPELPGQILFSDAEMEVLTGHGGTVASTRAENPRRLHDSYRLPRRVPQSRGRRSSRCRGPVARLDDAHSYEYGIRALEA